MNRLRTLLGLSASFALLCAGALPAHADVKEGVDAWGRGDYDAAVAQWQGPAAKGDADAMFNMGQAYKLGRGVPKDLAKAEDFYARAARKGHVRAADNYGILLFQTNRQAEAMPWLNAAVDRGEPRAMYILGIAAYNGDYAAQDLVRAYALMTRAAQAGLQQAITSLAAMNDAIPLAQRQQGVAMAEELDRKAVASRASELGSADLGSTQPMQPMQPLAPTGSAPIQRVDLAPAQVASAAPPAFVQPAPPAVPPRSPTPPTPRPVVVAHPVPAPRPAVAAPVHTASAATGGSWRVQLGAFGQKANADALWAKVRNRPELAGHPRMDVGSGVARLLAAGYSEAEATRACAGLKAAGLSCLVTSH